MKKSQVTAFMLVGIVMVIIFGFLFMFIAKVNSEHINAQLEKSINNVMQNTALQDYITACLEETAKDAMVLVGKQGGAIYANQVPKTRFSILENSATTLKDLRPKYVIPFPDPDNNELIYNVSIGIGQPTLSPPNWPHSQPLEIIQPGTPFKSDMPVLNIPPLCITEGSNARDLANILGIDSSNTQLFADFQNTCLNSYGPGSTQDYLQKYVNQEIQKCIDFGAFADDFGFSFNLEEPNTTVAFGEENLVFSLKYPFTFIVEGHEPVTRFFTYNKVFDIRLKKIILSAKRLISTDGRLPFFNIELDGNSANQNCLDKFENKVTCLDKGMFIERFFQVCDSAKNSFCNNKKRYTDVIRLTDDNSTINGEPYVFMFAMDNRNPALDKIDNSPHPDYEIIIENSTELFIDPVGIDFDEDNMDLLHNGTTIMSQVYSYSGWLQDHYDTFDAEACNENLVDCTQNPRAYTSPSGTTYTDPLGTVDQLVKLTDSKPFQTTQRQANHTILADAANPRDLGEHSIVVSVCDDENLCDWQELRILVIDQPTARINMYHNYPDKTAIPDYMASLEDPYNLNASNSEVVIGGPFDAYIWRDLSIPADMVHTSTAIVEYPDPSTYNIKTIKSFGFTSTVGNREIELTVVAPPNRYDSTTENITVQQCLPHRNPNRAPYPYNRVWASGYAYVFDPFQADHTCCLDTFQYAPSTQVCFQSTMYGFYPKLPDFTDSTSYGYTSGLSYTGPYTPLSTGPTWSTPRLPENQIWKQLNDVWQQTTVRSCSGDRGNVCSGSGEMVRSVYDDCSDDTLGHDRCYGPPATFSGSLGYSTNSYGGCTDYDGYTFEERFKIKYPEKFCDDTAFCTGPNTDYYVTNWTCGPAFKDNGNTLEPPTGTRYGCNQAKTFENCADRDGCYDSNMTFEDSMNGFGNYVCNTIDVGTCEYREYTCGLPTGCIEDPSMSIVDDTDGDLWDDNCDKYPDNPCSKILPSDSCGINSPGCQPTDADTNVYACECYGGDSISYNNLFHPLTEIDDGLCCGNEGGTVINSNFEDPVNGEITISACCDTATDCVGEFNGAIECFPEHTKIDKYCATDNYKVECNNNDWINIGGC